MRPLSICVFIVYFKCIILCEIIHSAQGVTKGNNIHLMSSTFQLEELLRKEVQIVQELNQYVSLLQEEIKKVQNYLDKNYQHEEFFSDKNKGIVYVYHKTYLN